ncbi:MAG: signal peptide peptidase SppA [Firmicutes bacterium]|nr:signal peptide peptidase SppA [Bacillota bacterium]MCL5038382.1 signal peptide peptidase SppA [Bacillota bacterium]
MRKYNLIEKPYRKMIRVSRNEEGFPIDREKGKRQQIIALVLIGLIVASAAGARVWGGSGARLPLGAGPATIGVIYIEGPIAGGHSQASLLGSTLGSDAILTYLRQARRDPGVKALVLRINSPGGSAAAAQEIGLELDRFRAARKIVVTSMGDVAASGGYWIAAKTDYIMANQATLTGSIGVIMELTNLEGLFQKIGMKPEVIKSGPYKDIGSPNRPLEPVERELLQAMVNDIYEQFVDVVAAGRKLPRERVKSLADGRVFTGRQAQALGLVDGFGNMQDAIDQTAKMAGLPPGAYEIREYGTLSPLERLLGLTRGESRFGLDRELNLPVQRDTGQGESLPWRAFWELQRLLLAR